MEAGGCLLPIRWRLCRDRKRDQSSSRGNHAKARLSVKAAGRTQT